MISPPVPLFPQLTRPCQYNTLVTEAYHANTTPYVSYINLPLPVSRTLHPQKCDEAQCHVHAPHANPAGLPSLALKIHH